MSAKLMSSVENYDWVDRRLEELYYGYALTAQNCDEYDEAGLLTENYAWVDHLLEMSNSFVPLCPVPVTWVDRRKDCTFVPIEYEVNEYDYDNESPDDVMVFEMEEGRIIHRLPCQSPVPSLYEYEEISEISSVTFTDIDENSYCDAV